MIPAAGASPPYTSQAASGESSRKAVSGSTSRSTRSRAVSFPRERWRSRAFSPPPAAIRAVRSRSSATSCSMRSRRRAKSSDSRSTFVVRTPTAVSLLRRPLGLVLDADGVCDPRDVVEVGDHLNGVVDRTIAPALTAQRLHVLRLERPLRAGELDREVAERPDAWFQIGRPVVPHRGLHELFVCALVTEVVGVGARSVEAVVGARDDDRQQLAL